MELGGKSAAVVYDDADLDLLLVEVHHLGVSPTLFGAVGDARLIVPARLHDEVVDRVVWWRATCTWAPASTTQLTPVVSQGRRAGRRLRRAGARQPRGRGAQQPGPDHPGWLPWPLSSWTSTQASEMAREECSARCCRCCGRTRPTRRSGSPTAPDYGLVAGVFTRDLDRALSTFARLMAGQVFVNEWFAGGIETPFGGVKRSGFGREKGQEALRNYVTTKNVAVRVADPGALATPTAR